ncbi:MAG: hypothetical protein RBR86_10180 [Pseudobdellovibrionaceae bacterium]|jgi:hypothetical protein|nr:hypothetical protein [Pseudobdellovibrionaceae bacterium]
MGNIPNLDTAFNEVQNTKDSEYRSRFEAAEDLLHTLLTYQISEFKNALIVAANAWPGLCNDAIMTFCTIGQGTTGAKASETTILLTATLQDNLEIIEHILEHDPLATPYAKAHLKDSPISRMSPIDLARKLGRRAIVKRMDKTKDIGIKGHEANNAGWQNLWRQLLNRRHE